MRPLKDFSINTKVRDNNPSVIAISGAHGTGKTTLCKMLKEHYGSRAISLVETARHCPFAINDGGGYDSERWILDNQMEQEWDATLRAIDVGADIIISDRTALDPVAYSRYLYERGNMDFQEYMEIFTDATRYVNEGHYDIIFYTPIEFPLVGDEKRPSDPGYQRYIDMTLRHLYDYAVWPQTYSVLTGSIQRRFGSIISEFHYEGIQ